MPRIPRVEVSFKIPKSWAAMADELALLSDQTRSGYIRDALIRQMMADWNTVPGRGFWLRPNQPVFERTDEGFRKVATTLGGERCWPIENLGQLPASLGGGICYRADIIPVGLVQGLTMSDAVVSRDSFGGPV